MPEQCALCSQRPPVTTVHVANGSPVKVCFQCATGIKDQATLRHAEAVTRVPERAIAAAKPATAKVARPSLGDLAGRRSTLPPARKARKKTAAKLRTKTVVKQRNKAPKNTRLKKKKRSSVYSSTSTGVRFVQGGLCNGS